MDASDGIGKLIQKESPMQRRNERRNVRRIERRNAALRFFGALFRYKALYFLLVPAAVSSLLFAYLPLGGLIVAFKNYDIWKGFFASPWAADYGFAHIIDLFRFKPIFDSILNTLLLSILNIAIGFPAPIVFALLINELRKGAFKKTVQTISYMPHFLSVIAVIGLTQMFFSEYGPLNDLLSLIIPGRARILYLSKQELFVPFQIFLGLWMSVGFSSIMYLAAITGVDPQLYEAASMDGAGRFKQIMYITLPGIAPTIIVLFIMSIGGLFRSNFQLVFGLQNPFINFETIDTVIYKYGLLGRDYSRATAVGLVQGLIALGLTVGANYISRKINEVSVF